MAEQSVSSKRNYYGVAAGVVVSAVVVAGTFQLLARENDPTRPVVLGEIVQRGAAAGFNVLLITLDTTRPDHLGCYGHTRARTPAIDSLLEHGVRFDDAVTSVPTTLASHATILTGLYPPSTGVRDNGVYRLAPKFMTLAEILAGQGYDTAAFVSSFVLDERFGLDQGFAVYDFKTGPENRRGPASLEHERRAHDVTTSAIGWLRARRRSGADARFFAWVHYFDPHHPYDSPVEGAAATRGDAYDAEIAFVDMHVRRLLNTIDESGWRDRTLVVVVSDHGEGLLEHGEELHGILLYESTVRVALLLSNPVLFDRPYRVDDRVVGTVDVLPTVLDLVGVSLATETDGQSLLTVGPAANRAIYIETWYPLSMGCSALRGLRRHTDKYVSGPRPEYYRLRQDPAELRDRYDDGGASLEALRRQLDALTGRWAENETTPLAQRVLSPEEQRQLEALGYVGSPRDPEPTSLPDPKDRIQLINQMNEVVRLLGAGRLEEALELAKEAADQSSRWRMPTLMMAEALMRLGRAEERVAVLAGFCDRRPTAEMLFYLAHALLQVKRYEECAEKLQAAELLDPRFGAVPALRGDLFFAQERYAEAAVQYEKAIERDSQRLGREVRANLEEAKRRMRGVSP